VLEPFAVDILLSGEEGKLRGGGQASLVSTRRAIPRDQFAFTSMLVRNGYSFAQDLGAPLLKEFDCDPVAWRASAEKLLSLNADILADGHTGVYQPANKVRRYIETCMRANLGGERSPSTDI
jgi:hypothetical protein